jgi:hypothetical protein
MGSGGKTIPVYKEVVNRAVAGPRAVAAHQGLASSPT